MCHGVFLIISIGFVRRWYQRQINSPDDPSTATKAIGMERKEATNKRQRIRKTNNSTFTINLVRFFFVSKNVSRITF